MSAARDDGSWMSVSESLPIAQLAAVFLVEALVPVLVYLRLDVRETHGQISPTGITNRSTGELESLAIHTVSHIT